MFGENNTRVPTVTKGEVIAYNNVFPSSRPKLHYHCANAEDKEQKNS